MQNTEPTPVDALAAPVSDGRSWRPTHVLSFAICLAAFVGVDVALPAATNSTNSYILGSIVVGQLVGQLAWLAVWVAMGPSRWLFRLSLAIAAEVVLYSALVLGIGFCDDDAPELSVMFRVLPVLPLTLLSTALPLLVLRGLTGWQIARASAVPTTATRRLAIRDLFALTATVAVSLAFSSIGLKSIPHEEVEDSVFTVVFSLVLAGLSLFLACPCVWSSLRVGSVVLGSVLAMTYLAALGIVGTFGIWLLAREQGGLTDSSPSELFWGFIGFNGGAVLTLQGSLVLARSCGYALLRVPRRRSRVDRAGPREVGGDD